jgi:hypothetical protein
LVARGLVIFVCLAVMAMIAIVSRLTSFGSVASIIGLAFAVLLVGPLWSKYSVLDKVESIVDRYPNAFLFAGSSALIFTSLYQAYNEYVTKAAPSGRKLRKYVFEVFGYEGVVVFWVLLSVVGIFWCIKAARRNA